jgi:hypothetical protein
MPFLVIAIAICIIASIFIWINLFSFVITGEMKRNKFWPFIQWWTVVIMPSIYLWAMDIGQANDCCTDSAVFSPDHRMSIYLLVIICMAIYLVCAYRKSIAPPLLELCINVFLLSGIILNVLIFIHLSPNDSQPFPIFGLLGNLSIIALFLIALLKNHQLLKAHLETEKLEINGWVGKLSWSILNLKPLYKYPILLLLTVPFLLFFALLLLIFGQKPDSLIRAFTDTYKHGLSEWDHLCDNVNCGGHFLCSVGANGHQSIVKPIRFGERLGQPIICNRQLLVSNAFEELLEEKMPQIHRFIRRNYNKVGNLVHRHYHIFQHKWVADLVYVLMKPLEYVFLLVLYSFDQKPENRIASQYLKKADRERIKVLNSRI